MADAVLVEAQNALLKTLEEPPSASAFVLVDVAPGRSAADGHDHAVSGFASAGWRR